MAGKRGTGETWSKRMDHSAPVVEMLSESALAGFPGGPATHMLRGLRADCVKGNQKVNDLFGASSVALDPIEGRGRSACWEAGAMRV